MPLNDFTCTIFGLSLERYYEAEKLVLPSHLAEFRTLEVKIRRWCKHNSRVGIKQGKVRIIQISKCYDDKYGLKLLKITQTKSCGKLETGFSF